MYGKWNGCAIDEALVGIQINESSDKPIQSWWNMHSLHSLCQNNHSPNLQATLSRNGSPNSDYTRLLTKPLRLAFTDSQGMPAGNLIHNITSLAEQDFLEPPT